VLEHEATTSKISDDQMFYCLQRGLNEEEAVALIVNGFVKDVLQKLPMEFEDILEMEPEERAAKGMFLSFQYPVEIPGVPVMTFVRTAMNSAAPATSRNS
jgi:Fe-S cluster assembly ATPase SufC